MKANQANQAKQSCLLNKSTWAGSLCVCDLIMETGQLKVKWTVEEWIEITLMK